MRRALAVCVACWGCAAGATDADRVTLLHRADEPAARLEDALLGPYRARHPGMRVVPVWVAAPQPEYGRRVRAALVSERMPDAFLLDDGDVPELVERGAILDLAPYLPRVGVDLARYDPTVLAIYRRGGAVYALPRGYTPLLVVYNRGLLERAGIGAPTDDWTWDDFLTIAKRLTSDRDRDGRPETWGAGWDRRPAFWLPWIWSGGGDVLCADGRRASGCLDAPPSVAAIRWYAGWVTQAHVSPQPYVGRDWNGELARLFAAGRLGMMTVDHSAVRDLRAATRRLRIGFVAIPHRAGVAPVTALYASGYGVPAQTLGRKPAVELVAALTDSVAGAARGEAGLELPTVTAAAEALAAADSLGWEAAYLRAAKHGRPGWSSRVVQWDEVEAVLGDLMDRLTTDGVDPGASIARTARELDRLLGATQ
ncbi:MAG TPA: extracellular solute-binding protein [Gemmatimonadales bacterium]|nr:extracellular solute-binding protein [Gemmatimonadales bacterium]